MSNGNEESASENAETLRGSRISIERKRSMTEHMDHDVYVLASRLEEEFSCVSSTSSPEVWYIDSGASSHMTRVWECFSDY